MSLFSPLMRVLRAPSSGSVTVPRFDGATTVTYSSNALVSSSGDIEHAAIAELWRGQPHLRTVVDYVAKNVAQLGLHAYVPSGEGPPQRDYDTDLARLMSEPSPRVCAYDTIRATAADIALYDRAFWLVLPDADSTSGYQLNVVPAAWVTVEPSGAFGPRKYHVAPLFEDGKVTPQDTVTYDETAIVEFAGWAPDSTSATVSPVESLRLTLEEQHHSRIYRRQTWRNSGRFGVVYHRPVDAPPWDDAARGRFSAMIRAFSGNQGTKAGTAPILEDGMKAEKIGFSAKDEEWADATRLSLETVAQVYHVNPALLGQTDKASYASVREARKSLYGDSLAPLLRKIEQTATLGLRRIMGGNFPEGGHLEFNVEAKLRGNFEEQAAVMSTAIGAPWMTRNEGRALINRGPVEGGDELITPLNVVEGGQASPQDGVTGNGGGVSNGQGAVDDVEAAKVAAVVESTQVRVTAKLADVVAKGERVDIDALKARFSRELGADLRKVGASVDAGALIDGVLRGALANLVDSEG